MIGIVGPTASGKTGLVLKVAEMYCQQAIDRGEPIPTIELISVDSKQVYKDIPILSGADIPTSWKQSEDASLRFAFWVHPDLPIRLHGVSMLAAATEWSITQFAGLVQEVRSVVSHRPRLCVFVGGTAQYHLQWCQVSPEMRVPPDSQLRAAVASLPLDALQDRVRQANPARWAGLNSSDRSNPRRLVRILEQAHAGFQNQAEPAASVVSYPLVGVMPEGGTATLVEQIRTRVAARLRAGVLEEVAQVAQLPSLSAGIQSTIGFELTQAHLSGVLSRSQLVERWVLAEHQYAKRQLTWWKREAVTWLTPDDPSQVLQLGASQIERT